MLKEKNKAFLEDKTKKNEITLSFNPEESDIVPMTFKGEDGKTHKAILSRDELWTFSFLTAREQQQADMLPTRQTQIRKMMRKVQLQAKKDIKKGEFITTYVEVNVPTAVYEGLTADIKAGRGKKIL